MQNYGDILSRSTEEPEGYDLSHSKCNQEEDNDTNFDDISSLFEERCFKSIIRLFQRFSRKFQGGFYTCDRNSFSRDLNAKIVS